MHLMIIQIPASYVNQDAHILRISIVQLVTAFGLDNDRLSRKYIAF